MDMFGGSCEIVESTEELDAKFNENFEKKQIRNSGYKYSIEDDITRLFGAIDIRNSTNVSDRLHKGSKDPLRNSASKKPMGVGSSRALGIGISEPASLKQALRGLCISQASQMAAIKRLSKPAGSSRISEAGTIKRLYSSMVVEANGSSHPLTEAKGKFVEISLIAQSSTLDSSEDGTSNAGLPVQNVHASSTSASPMSPKKIMATLATQVESKAINEDGKMGQEYPSFTHTDAGVLEVDSVATASFEVPIRTPVPENGQTGDLISSCSTSSSYVNTKLSKPGNSPSLVKPAFLTKKFFQKKVKPDITSASSSLKSYVVKLNHNFDPCTTCTSTLDCHSGNCTLKNEDVDSCTVDPDSSKLGFNSKCSGTTKSVVTKACERSISSEKGEFSESSISSIVDCGSSTSISVESSLSGSSCSGHRPHMSRDLRWEAIRCVQKQHGTLGLRHFKLLKRLGCGDIGTVYLADLTGTNCQFALKVMDSVLLMRRKKSHRAQTEREILQMLDHPFLPTLYANFATDKHSCLVMEYCPGGDLHVMRQKQPNRSFSEQAARFFLAEILLALEYLHMFGVVYRDLKAENILVREDGHIMLTDFDLSLRCAVNPVLLKPSSPDAHPTKKMSTSCTEYSCIAPFCFQPSFSCFTPKLQTVSQKAHIAAQSSQLPQLVVEPTHAKSNSFVGTHEYMAPEIIKGEGHGNAVDWWAFGIFLFELLYGTTPFKGSGEDETLSNIVSSNLKFPNSPIISFQARDLIRGLLVKEPESRLGSVKGAAEIKKHPFFEGLNWALIRCATPPDLLKFYDVGGESQSTITHDNENIKCEEIELIEEQMGFNLF